VQVTCRGAFAYAAGVLPGGQAIPLFRLRYGGSAHSFGFALYTSRERYEDALLLTGYPTGTPQEALDTACTVNLAGLGHEPDSEPSTNLRRCPLSQPVSPSSASSPSSGAASPARRDVGPARCGQEWSVVRGAAANGKRSARRGGVGTWRRACSRVSPCRAVAPCIAGSTDIWRTASAP